MSVYAKSNLTGEQLTIVESEMNKKAKNKVVLYLLWWFTGVFGGHRFYLGDTGYALGMLFTLGGLGFWALIDVFLIGKRLEQINEEIENEIITRVKAWSK